MTTKPLSGSKADIGCSNRASATGSGLNQTASMTARARAFDMLDCTSTVVSSARSSAIGARASVCCQRTQSAIERFEADHRLTITGQLDGQTKAKLKEIHGC